MAKLSKLEKSNKEMQSLTDELASSLPAYEAMQKARMKLFDKLKKTREKVAKLELETMDKTSSQYFQWLLAFDDTMEKHNEHDHFSYNITNGCLCFSGYFHEIMQNALQLRLKSDSDTLKVEVYLSAMLPFVLPVVNGYKSIGILENTCSAYGSFNLEIKDDEYVVVKYVYGRRRVEKTFDTLINVLDYIAKNVNLDETDYEDED